MKGKKMNDVVNRIYVAEPRARDHKERPPVIPQVRRCYRDMLFYKRDGPDLVQFYAFANLSSCFIQGWVI